VKLPKLQIGDVNIPNPLVLAPMAGISNIAFRILAKEQGAGLVCSEFVSAKAIYYGNQKTQDMLIVDEKEHPISIQIFGGDSESLVEGARAVVAVGADIVDINMGCPVPKVVKTGSGAALMKDPVKAWNLAADVVKAVDVPVTVKMRAGWDDQNINAPQLAEMLEDIGVAAVTIHGRTRAQLYQGKADWDIIGKVKESVSIPVIGNGDIYAPTDAEQMLEETGVDGVMIARGALGNPWIFHRTWHYLQTGELLPEPSVDEKLGMIKRHADLLIAYKGEKRAIREMRQHLPYYTKGLRGSSQLRKEMNQCQTREGLEQLLDGFLAVR